MKKISCLILFCSVVLCLLTVVSCTQNKVQADGVLNGLLIRFNEKRDACTVVGTDGSVKDIIIPNTCSGLPIIGIAEYAFSGNEQITSITLSENIQSIGTCAFSDCTNLKKVVIPASVIRLEHSVFSGCKNLESVEFIRTNENVTKGLDCTFGEFIFKDCTSLKTVTMGDGIKKIGSRMFYNCTSLENITISKTVTSIDKYAFAYCTSLKEITIPESVTALGENVFKGCSALKKITTPFIGTNKYGTGSVKINYFFGEGSAISNVPDSLTSVTITGAVKIGDGALEGCSNITEIVLSDKVSYIGNNAFAGTKFYDNKNNWENDALYIGNHLIKVNNTATNYQIKEGTLCIAGGAFTGCGNLVDVNIPDSVVSIGNSAFYSCTSIKNIVVPDSVVIVGESAFSGCTALNNVTLGSGVKNLGSNAFNGCNALQEITCNFASQPKTWDEGWKGDCQANVNWNASQN